MLPVRTEVVSSTTNSPEAKETLTVQEGIAPVAVLKDIDTIVHVSPKVNLRPHLTPTALLAKILEPNRIVEVRANQNEESVTID